tara:strand:- start:1488 stop:1835 length:348 start_codon:yes stop_codon:yes gene_type:complete
MNEVDKYISTFPEEIQNKLNTLRELVFKLVPDAVEDFAYKMPSYKYKKRPLVYFGGYKKHIGYYMKPMILDRFRDQFGSYKNAKGSVQFPVDDEFPIELITKMILNWKNELDDSN